MHSDDSSYNAFPELVKRVSARPELRHGIVAIGNFDGVHRGHQALLQRGRALANQDDCSFTVLTFNPHPRRYFQPASPPFLINQPALKHDLLIAHGADDVISLPFDDALSRLSAMDFITYVLEGGLAAKHIIVGQNFVFGYGRQGHVDTLLAHGFDVTALAPVARADGLVYSSTAVRQALQTEGLIQAIDVLGRDWSVSGPVITGKQVGRTLGYPTANIAWPAEIIHPLYGVYAVHVQLADGTMHKGVASIGLRPTVTPQAIEPLLEVHLFDFTGDLYGRILNVQFKYFVRQEETFADLDTLKRQMAIDCQIARESLV